MIIIKLWVDDIRPAPEGYVWAKSVNQAEEYILMCWWIALASIEEINLDYDAGDYASDGGDYIKLLDWLEENDFYNKTINFHIHSMNPVGVANMRTIIQKNGWKEI